MTTILLMSVAFLGLGLLLPTPGIDGFRTLGLRLVGGATLFQVLLFVLHVVARVPLRIAVFTVLAVAVFGLLRRWRTICDGESPVACASHPAVLLTALGLVAVAINGGVGYIPYSVDEFTNWLGASRLIHLTGGYEAVRTTIHLQGYTPGWRLLILTPWQILGSDDAGLSAPIIFVLHVAVAAFIFDVVAWMLRAKAGLRKRTVNFGAWLFLLLFLGAEVMGRLWMYNLLVEQPQIYFFVAALAVLFLAEAADAMSPRVLIHAGLAVAGGYLIKAAAVTLLPGFGIAALALMAGRTVNGGERMQRTLLAGLALCLPTVILMALWSPLVATDDCLAGSMMKNFEAETIARVATMDWQGLATRFTNAVWNYSVGYKTPLLLAAGAGVYVALVTRRWRSILAWAGFTSIYLGILAWLHLSCFGPWYFENLNSIPRLTRVPLQVLHALGLLALAFGVAVALQGAWGRRLDAIFRKKWIMGIALLILASLGAWQARAVYRSVVDVTERRYQGVSPRVFEARRAVARIMPLRGELLPDRPGLVVIDQGGDNDLFGYINYFAMEKGPKGVRSGVNLRTEVSWGAEKKTPWTHVRSPDSLRALLGEADIVWPMRLDDWMVEVLRPLVSDPKCLAVLPAQALVWGDDGVLRCLPKDAPRLLPGS